MRIQSPASTPTDGQYVALVVAPLLYGDYHWYRRDVSNQWSHKPGRTPARDTDNSGRVIADPEVCDRGPYTQFCGYYHCIPAKTKIL